MLQRIALRGLAIPSVLLVAACSQSPQSPVSPSVAAGSTAANAGRLDPEGHGPDAGVAGQRRHHRRQPADVRLRQLDRQVHADVAPLYRIQLFDGGGSRHR